MPNSLAHTKWVCRYYIVFTPKYVRKTIKYVCKWKGVEIMEGHTMPDYIRLLVEISTEMSASQFMGYIKSKKCNDDIQSLRKFEV